MRLRRVRVGSAASRAVQLRAHHHHQQQQLQQEQQWLLEQLQQLGLQEAEGSAGGVQGWLQGEGLRAVPEMVLRFLQDDAGAAADEGS
jgi:hypothetical protein